MTKYFCRAGESLCPDTRLVPDDLAILAGVDIPVPHQQDALARHRETDLFHPGCLRPEFGWRELGRGRVRDFRPDAE